MSFRNSPLDHVRVAAPCPAEWDSMIGSERVRFCGQCQLNVYNLSEMSKREAEALITKTEGRLCVRYYQRADGTILTNNCPVGLRALKRRVSRVTRATISAVLGFLAGVGFNFAVFEGVGSVFERRAMGVMATKRPSSGEGVLIVQPVKIEPRRPAMMGDIGEVRLDLTEVRGRLKAREVKGELLER